MSKFLLMLGAGNAALTVILGAFGAHALKGRLDPARLDVFQTGVQYHFYHALGLMVLGLVFQQFGSTVWLRGASWSMSLGILLFSGSLYALALGAPRAVGIITPFGGLAFIAAWLMLMVGLWRSG